MAKKTLTPMLDVFEKNKYDLRSSLIKSKAWMEQQVLLLSKKRITPGVVLRGNPDQLTTRLIPGHMYMFSYDPKLKTTLPYYDQFPLVLPFRKTPDGFIGLNLHYLPYHLRAALLDRLLIYVNNNKMDETTRLKFSWAAIEGVSRFKAAQPCVKQYLIGHVRSQFRQIPSNDWATALLLPVERFIGSSKEAVWADSRKVIR